MAKDSNVLPEAEQQQVADVLEDDAEVMSNSRLEQLLVDQPPEIQDEIISINTDARPQALQVALLIPILAALAGLFNSFRLLRLPEPKPSAADGGTRPGLNLPIWKVWPPGWRTRTGWTIVPSSR
jgi:hypothetical protein